jgi:hypothetical protein
MSKYILGVMIFSLGLMGCNNDTIPAQLITPVEKVIPPAEPVIPLAEPVLTMSFTPTKAFRFNWPAATNATYYELYETATIGAGYDLIKKTTATSFDHVVPLYARLNAKYMLKSCNESACSPNSVEVFTSTKIAEMTSSIGYAKASNADSNDYFGSSVSLSSDGNTLAVGAYDEGSNAKGIGGDEDDNSLYNAGAVYVFSRSDTKWTQQAYVKASNTHHYHWFGYSVSLSSDGNTLAVGAVIEGSNATGIGGDEEDYSKFGAGAVYVFSRSDTKWTQQAYVKASNTDESDQFGRSVSLSSDGNTLAVGARFEDSNAKGINRDGNNNSAPDAGAVYVFSRSGTKWTQQAYVKASNTDESDQFGDSVSLSSDGNTLAVGARGEGSNATGIGGEQGNDLTTSAAGAVYVFSRSDNTWTQQAYVKASNTNANDQFGYSVSLSSDGNTLAVGAPNEGSNARGIGADDDEDNSAPNAGAVYVFSRSDTEWTQQAYVKASNTGADDLFGYSVSLSSDGNTLAVGAYQEESNARGIGEDEEDNSTSDAGAVYVFSRLGIMWTQQAYVKASNPGANDWFGSSVSLSSDGNTLAVGASREDSNATGIGGDEDDNSKLRAGAVYLY